MPKQICIKQVMGEDITEKVSDAYTKYEFLEFERFFHSGIRFALELLRLYI